VNVQDLDWPTIRERVTRRVARKYPWASREAHEDAVADALLALVDKWDSFPSSRTVLAEGDASKVNAYATRYATWWALNKLGEQRNESLTVLHLVDGEDMDSDQPSHTIAVDVLSAHADTRSDDEREDDMRERLLRAVGSMEGLAAATTAPSAKH